jgi:hypothetical protein
MITTPELVRLLVADAGPVRRLRPPLLRAGIWVAAASVVLAMVAIAFGLRADLGVKLREPVFLIEVASAALTGIAAAIAAFHLSLPDRAGLWALLPMPSLVLWLSTVGYNCLTNWVTLGPEGLTLGTSLVCFGTITLGSTPIALILIFMLRHARLVRPVGTALTGAFAVAGLTVSALRLFHDLDATVMVLIWNVGAGAAISAAVALFGCRLLLSSIWSTGPRGRLPA